MRGTLVSVALALVAALSAPGAVADAATTSCTADPGWGTPAATKTAEMFELVNVHRAAVGLPVLLSSPSLTDSASWKSMHMAGYGYLNHDDPATPVARTWEQRLADCGYPGVGGENISFGYDSALVTLQGWLSSPGHRANLEDPNFKVMGIGAARSADGTYYWAQNFGREIDEVPSEPAPTTSPGDGTTEITDGTAEITDGTTEITDGTTEITDGTPEITDGTTEITDGTPEITDGTTDTTDGTTDTTDGTTDTTDGTPEITDGTPDTPDAAPEDEVVNRAPVARNDSKLSRTRWVRIRVLRNDSDANGDRLEIARIIARPSKGRVRISDTRKFIRYRPRRGAGGRDRLAYVVVDERGGAATAVVNIRIKR